MPAKPNSAGTQACATGSRVAGRRSRSASLCRARSAVAVRSGAASAPFLFVAEATDPSAPLLPSVSRFVCDHWHKGEPVVRRLALPPPSASLRAREGRSQKKLGSARPKVATSPVGRELIHAPVCSCAHDCDSRIVPLLLPALLEREFHLRSVRFLLPVALCLTRRVLFRVFPSISTQAATGPKNPPRWSRRYAANFSGKRRARPGIVRFDPR